MPARDDLTAFRWHTGATLRPLADGEACPVLFRDVGPVALAMFLRRSLPRLAGPLSPIVYTRTAEFVEPYTDHERTGRLVVLRGRELGVWHSGVPHIYVARARSGVDFAAVGFVPGDMPLSVAARLAAGAGDVGELREALGGRAYDDAAAESLLRLDRLAEELAATERAADPLRKALQSGDRTTRERAKADMARVGLSESDLCTAWHHLPRDRRGEIAEALRSLPARVGGFSGTPLSAGERSPTERSEGGG